MAEAEGGSEQDDVSFLRTVSELLITLYHILSINLINKYKLY